MGRERLQFRPGVNTQMTETANQAGISESNLVRWRQGLLERMGGWQRLTGDRCAGYVRAMHAYRDTDNVDTLLLGTDGGAQIYDGQISDISLVASDPSLTPPWYTFTAGNTTVTVTSTAHGMSVNDTIQIPMLTGGGPDGIKGTNRTSGTANDMNDCVWASSLSLFVAVGASGTILTSPTGTTWTPRTSGVATDLNRIAWNGTRLVAVGASGVVRYSTDGSTWNGATSGVSTTLRGVVWSGSLFIAVGDNGTVIESSDGITWTDRTFVSTDDLYGVAWGASIFVAVGQTDGGAAVIYSSPTGTTWTSRTSSTTDGLRDVAFGVSTFVAGGVNGSITKSTNGTSWSSATSNFTTGTIRKILFSTDQFVLLGNGGGLVTSEDGTSFIAHGSEISTNVYGAGASGTLMVWTGAGGGIRTVPTDSKNTLKIPANFYTVLGVTDANTFTFTAPTAAAVTGTQGGYPPLYAVNFPGAHNTGRIRVYLRNHGYGPGDTHNVYFQVTLTGPDIVLLGSYVVVSVPNSYCFEIDSAQVSFIPTYVAEYENGGSGSLRRYSSLTIPNTWSVDNFGKYGLYNPQGGGIYVYTPPIPADRAVVAVTVANSPRFNTGMFVAMPQAQIIAYGSETVIGSGTLDPLLVRWTDTGDFTVWTASITNQAGSYRLSNGSRIVGAIQAPQAALLWTDIGLWTMQYVGGDSIYSFLSVATGCGLIAQKGAVTQGSVTYWMGNLSFFTFGQAGGVQPLECTVRDWVFNRIDRTRLDKLHAGSITATNEVWWFFASTEGTGEVDSYVKYNTLERIWDYGYLIRTSFIDDNVFGYPLAPTITSVSSSTSSDTMLTMILWTVPSSRAAMPSLAAASTLCSSTRSCQT